MATNKVQEYGNRIPITVTTNVTAGQPYRVGHVVGIVVDDIASGDSGYIDICGVWEVPVSIATATTTPAAAHWDESAKKFIDAVGTANQSSDVQYVGLFTEPLGTSASTGKVRLNPGGGRPGA